VAGQAPKGSYAPLWGARAAGGHDDPVEGISFFRPAGGWGALGRPELGHPPELAAAAARYGEAAERTMHGTTISVSLTHCLMNKMTLRRLSAAPAQRWCSGT
jgi:hypothetical protein